MLGLLSIPALLLRIVAQTANNSIKSPKTSLTGIGLAGVALALGSPETAFAIGAAALASDDND